jgi:hypothetical protein
MEHINDQWTADEVATAISPVDPSNPEKQQSALGKLIEAIAGTPAGDWNECPLCLDQPTMAVMTSCRHVFCSECINGCFEMPTARGVVADDDDDDADVEEVGQSIACPVCRHKLFRQNIGTFTAPDAPAKEGVPPPPVAQPSAESIERFKKIEWEVPDDSDDESLPDLSSLIPKPAPKESMKENLAPAPVLAAPPVVEYDSDEDLLAVFRRNPVPRTAKTVKRANTTQFWQEIMDREDIMASTKLTALKEQITEWREEHPNDKIIIFSQFVRALDLVEKVFQEQGWISTRYQGDMTLEQRETSLRTFEEEDDVGFMLTSLKCGGVGLNLTGLSLMYLLTASCESCYLSRFMVELAG